jgi:hypothetical protein
MLITESLRLKKVFFFIATVVLTHSFIGCSFGPHAVSQSRVDYNEVFNRTDNEQILLNLVRLRYRDTPFFMETASISTSFSFDIGTSMEVDILPGAENTYILAPNIGYGEKPTITYTPLQGEKFVKQMLSPLDLHTLMLLYHSGWSIERLLRVTAQGINGILNAPTASGPTPSTPPEYEHFREIAELVRELQQKNAIVLAQSQDGSQVVFDIVPNYQQDDAVQKFKRLLNLDAATLQFTLIPAVGYINNSQSITLQLRSMLASMYYLSQAVEVPVKDQEANRVTTTRHKSGEVFDWKKVTENLFWVHTSSSNPNNAYIAVKYREAWFYIDDSDLSSKSTFSLLKQLLALQSGDTKSQAPVLTIPIQ